MNLRQWHSNWRCLGTVPSSDSTITMTSGKIMRYSDHRSLFSQTRISKNLLPCHVTLQYKLFMSRNPSQCIDTASNLIMLQLLRDDRCNRNNNQLLCMPHSMKKETDQLITYTPQSEFKSFQQ